MNEKLESRIERFIRTGAGDFGVLALELFSRQYDKNANYQLFCNTVGVSPSSVNSWQEIPAVPVQAFKSTELVTFPSSQAAAVFHSSGTTQQRPSRHFLRTLTYYEASLAWGFEKWVLKGKVPLPLVVLAPSPAEAPHSSLSWMLDVVKRRWGGPGSDYFVQRGLVQDWRLFRFLDVSKQTPVILLGTTLAFLTLFDQCKKQGRTFRCPPGSRLMDTGGMKTRERAVTREEFLRAVWRYLGIPEAECVNEYGMCELSSQFYSTGASMVFQGPSWVRTLVIHPLTGRPVATGESGLLRHVDLANVDSVLAVQTEDVGELQADGFRLKGRATDAEQKGCSIDLEAYLKST